MIEEKILPKRSTLLRENGNNELNLNIIQPNLYEYFMINGSRFITGGFTESDYNIKSNQCYMIINYGDIPINIQYDQDISNHRIIYNPYKYEFTQRVNFKLELFIDNYDIPKGYVSTLPKWYSFKFTYPDYNLIFIRPEFGLSVQIHKFRNESWEILDGKPIIITGNKVYYFVENGQKFHNPINTYHSIINPNIERNNFVVIKERWNGKFDESDINRVFNPNNYK